MSLPPERASLNLILIDDLVSSLHLAGNEHFLASHCGGEVNRIDLCLSEGNVGL